jgi:K+-sensing histidine kinase KdpD
MGKFTMLILGDRAQRRGVTQVDYVVREGNVRKQLRQFAVETQANVMVMGRPTRSPGRNLFNAAEFEAFVAKLGREGNLHVVQVMPSAEAERTDF